MYFVYKRCCAIFLLLAHLCAHVRLITPADNTVPHPASFPPVYVSFNCIEFVIIPMSHDSLSVVSLNLVETLSYIAPFVCLKRLCHSVFHLANQCHFRSLFLLLFYLCSVTMFCNYVYFMSALIDCSSLCICVDIS